MNEVVWTPNAEHIARSRLSEFAQFARTHHGAPSSCQDPILDWTRLWQWSIEHRDAFWNAVVAFTGVRAEHGTGPILQDGGHMLDARWFAGTKLNFAENLLSRRDAHPAVVSLSEQGERVSWSYLELHTRVARVAAGLRREGIVAGDVVAGFLPNIAQAVVAMLATTSLGAIWTSCSPDFGRQGVLDRFGQVRPKVLFTADGYRYAGKAIDSLATIRELLAALPDVRRVVVIPHLTATPDITEVARGILLGDFEAEEPLEFVRRPFDAPLYIMYSSGTTGVPKCIVHGIGGTLLQHLKEHQLHTDLGVNDRLFFFTTCGWMMWNWTVSALATGATIVLYDGSPLHPDPAILWRMAEREQLTHLGTSPKYLSALEKADYQPRRHHDLSALRVLLSTGSPLAAEQYDFVERSVKPGVQLASISGGTDIISCFCLGNPWLPVHRGEIQSRGLGMAVEVWDDDGRPITGQRGELVCTRAFPSMPIGFWNDPDQARYRAAYFERFPGVWHHGDYALLSEPGGIVILGRSDAVLNPGGVRIGTAEIYRQVERLDEVIESLAIGQDWQGDVRVILFVRLRPEHQLDDSLRQKIRNTIRANTTPRHVPAKIIAVADIPRTISGKIVELAVRNIVHGLAVKNTDALANPNALDYFRNLTELQQE